MSSSVRLCWELEKPKGPKGEAPFQTPSARLGLGVRGLWGNGVGFRGPTDKATNFRVLSARKSLGSGLRVYRRAQG